MEEGNKIQLDSPDGLITELKKSFSSEESKLYVKSFENLEDLFRNEIKDNQDVDVFSLECIQLFYKDDYGFPDQMYKGLPEDLYRKYLEGNVRALKASLISYCQKREENHVDLTIGDTIAHGAIELLADYITKTTGLTDPFVKLYIIGVIHFCRKKTLNSICEAISE